jgi:two-component system, OmpR family, osmolarity sensor histidine kinase EnvZ
MSSSPIDAAAAAGDVAVPGVGVASHELDIRQHSRIKRLLPQTMFGRSLLLMITPLVLVQVIATWIFYERHWETVAYRLSADVAGEIGMVIDSMRTSGSDADLNQLFDRVSGSTELGFTFDGGAVLPLPAEMSGTILEKQLRRAMIERVHRPFRIDAVSCERCVLIAVQLADGVLAVNTPRSRLYTPTTYIFILWMVGSSVVFLVISAIFLRNQVKSLRRLAAAAESFGKGREVSITRAEGAREIRQAAAAFIRMRERIQRQIRQRTEMLAGVSHDLRTPLTRMKLALEFLADDPAAAELKSDVVEMEKLIALYLDFARGEGTETPIETDLAQLVEEIAAASQREGVELTVEQSSRLVVPVRRGALRRCLNNLVANAGRYGGQVWVSSVPAEDGVDILIDDNGPGIPPEERDRVFQPFVRLDTSRNPATGGIGLGLTIARDVARSHGGDVRLEDSPHGGLRARIHLPR